MGILVLSRCIGVWTVIHSNMLQRPAASLPKAISLSCLGGSGEIRMISSILCSRRFLKYHNFKKVDAHNPGVILAKEHLELPEVRISIFKRGVNAAKVRRAGTPDEISPGGLTRERQEYL